MPSLLTHLAKEAFEATRRPVLRATAGAVSPRAAELVAEVRRTGFAVIPGYWAPERCDTAARDIDSLCGREGLEGSWVDAKKSDHRFFRAERHAPSLESFRDDALIEEVRRAYTGRRQAEKFVLAARMDFKDGNAGSGGGWHLDSPHSLQFKAIMYLSDCSPENGPFQLIPGSHDRGLLLSLLAKGKRKPGQYRFTDAEIAGMDGVVREPKTFIGAKGTVILADVTALHRGTPIRAGSRYALTLYCGDPALGVDY